MRQVPFSLPSFRNPVEGRWHLSDRRERLMASSLVLGTRVPSSIRQRISLLIETETRVGLSLVHDTGTPFAIEIARALST
jgi:hypothetical protein